MKYGRIALFDVIVQFDRDVGRKFFSSLKVVLSPRGLILITVPNSNTPWG